MKDIARYWLEESNSDGDWVFSIAPNFYVDPGEPSCFGCGWRVPDRVSGSFDQRWSDAGAFLERAHLIDHHEGGSSDPSNYVPLCRQCHVSIGANCAYLTRTAALEAIKALPERGVWEQLATDESKEFDHGRGHHNTVRHLRSKASEAAIAMGLSL